MRWIFVRKAVIEVNAVKKNFSPHLTAFLTKIHRISYKNSPHRLLWQINVRNAVNAMKKNNSAHFNAFLTKIHREIHRISYEKSPHIISNVYSIWFKFTRFFKDVSDSWRRGLSSWRHAGGQRFETESRRFFFVRILRTVENCMTTVLNDLLYWRMWS